MLRFLVLGYLLAVFTVTVISCRQLWRINLEVNIKEISSLEYITRGNYRKLTMVCLSPSEIQSDTSEKNSYALPQNALGLGDW
jgi:hypothetical protein